MRVLAYIHTFNDADVIERAVEGVQRQTRPADGVVIVDNASTDGTLDRQFPEGIAIIRNSANLGTSGAVGIGFSYALSNGFDWMWILDADSVPEPDALERVLELYSGWPQSLRDETGLIACLPRNEPNGDPVHGLIFTPYGRSLVSPPPEPRYYACHVSIWSGCMYRLAVVRRIGLPNPDYFCDRDDVEYDYRMMKAGFKAFMHQDAIIRHNIRGTPGLHSKRRKLGPISVVFYELPPMRCYYTVRNTLYFTLYDSGKERIASLRSELWRLRSRPGRSFMSGIAWQVALLTLNFAVRPRTHGAQARACLRGIWHGVTGNIASRY